MRRSAALAMAAVLVPAAGAVGVMPSASALVEGTPAPAAVGATAVPPTDTPTMPSDTSTTAPTTAPRDTPAAPPPVAPPATSSDTPTTTPSSPPTPRPTSPKTNVSQHVRMSLQCSGCPGPLQFVTGVGQLRLVGTTLPARPGARVSIQRRAPGGSAYGQVAEVTTDRTGAFTWTGPMGPAGTSSYRAVLPGQATSSVASATVVDAAITASAPAGQDTLVDPTVSGVATPRAAGLQVRTEVLTPVGWRTSQVGMTRSGGGFALPLTYGRGAVGVVTVRTAMTLPGGRVVASPSRAVNRLAVLNPVVRQTVAADVPRTYRAGCPVGPASLRTIDMNHWGFDGRIHRGRLVIRTANVTPILTSFRTAFDGRFPIREMRDASVYGGDDIISMEHDNTNGFNCRRVTGNPYRLSPHSYGTSIDINTVENPYRIPSGVWLPKNGQVYVRRTPYRPGMLTPSTPFTKALLGNGFTWLSGFDWQHFQR